MTSPVNFGDPYSKNHTECSSVNLGGRLSNTPCNSPCNSPFLFSPIRTGSASTERGRLTSSVSKFSNNFFVQNGKDSSVNLDGRDLASSSGISSLFCPKETESDLSDEEDEEISNILQKKVSGSQFFQESKVPPNSPLQSDNPSEGIAEIVGVPSGLQKSELEALSLRIKTTNICNTDFINLSTKGFRLLIEYCATSIQNIKNLKKSLYAILSDNTHKHWAFLPTYLLVSSVNEFQERKFIFPIFASLYTYYKSLDPQILFAKENYESMYGIFQSIPEEIDMDSLASGKNPDIYLLGALIQWFRNLIYPEKPELYQLFSSLRVMNIDYANSVNSIDCLESFLGELICNHRLYFEQLVRSGWESSFDSKIEKKYNLTPPIPESLCSQRDFFKGIF